jgi:hypothetical protein
VVSGLEAIFPGLHGKAWSVTSASDHRDNCIAWAVGITDAWLWPEGEEATWPFPVREVTIAAFCAGFATLDYTPCETDGLEAGFERVALFALEGIPTHAARQLPHGRWTSKLGQREDIEHDLRDLEGAVYGKVVQVLRRPVPAALPG